VRFSVTAVQQRAALQQREENSMDDQFSDQVEQDRGRRRPGAAQASRRTMDEGGKAASQIAETCGESS